MMEMHLKERLVGAVVLVLAAVVFIPMVLDGPDTDRTVSQSVALPDADTDPADGRRTVRIDLSAGGTDAGTDVTPPVATLDPQEPASIDLTQQQSVTENRSVQPSVPASPTPTETVTERATQQAAREPEGVAVQPWTVQAGSFGREGNAETLAATLRKLGYPAFVSRFNDGNSVHYRVRVGGFPSREAAQQRADEIRAKTGEPARPVQNR